MNFSFSFRRVGPMLATQVLIALLAASPATLSAQVQAKIPTGKIYVANVEGGSQIANGEVVHALAVKSSFVAQGSRIETRPQGTLALVLSNGTGLFLDEDTHIEIKRFTQEPFVANRTDLEIEPSVSSTEISLAQGTLAVSTSKLAAGSSLTFLTPLASVHVHGGELVIAASAGEVKVSLLEGEATVRGGDLDLGGRVLHSGEQAVIRPGAAGEPNIVTIQGIPANELAAIQEQAAMARAARRTVFFEADDTGEVSAVPVVQASIPVQATVSPSQLPQ